MAARGTIAEVETLLRARRPAEAARRLIDAAGRGEPGTAAVLAHWRIVGNVVRRDLGDARRLLAVAGAAGDDGAALLHAYFLAAGVGGPDDWPGAVAAIAALTGRVPAARTQRDLLDAMDLDFQGFPKARPEARPLDSAPFAAAAAGFMTEAECAYLRVTGEPALEPSMVVDPASGAMVPHPVRRSDAAMFGVWTEDLVVNAINRRIAALTGTRLDQGEPLQLLRYRAGGEYRTHMDALPAEPNQRILTVLVYLSDDYRGGETSFPRAGLSFRGGVGEALMFRNAGEDGRPDPLTLHAGQPVTGGVKYLASRWIRAARFSFPPPRPLVDL